MLSRSIIRLAAAMGVAVALWCGRAQAALLWYDGFELGQYSEVAPLGGQAGGSGTFYAGPWIPTPGNESFVQPGGLSYPRLLTSGGATADDDPDSCCIFARNAREFASPWNATTSGTFYMSFLANFGTDGDPLNYGLRTFEMWNGAIDDMTNVLRVGYSQFGNFPSSTEMGLNVGGQSTTLAGSPQFATDGDTHLMVLKFTLGTATLSDAVSVYLDPTSPIEADQNPNATITGLNFLATASSAMSQFSFSGNPNPAALDEIRVATTFEEAVPLPFNETSTLAATGLWTDGGIWSTPFFPNNGNGGVNYDVVVDSPNAVVIPAAIDIVIDRLSLSDGLVTSNGSLAVEVQTSWTAGTMSGSGTIALNGTTNISGAAQKVLSGNLTNSGTLTWSGGTVLFAQSGAVQAQLHNAGTIELAAGGTSFDFSSGSPSFVNTANGTLRRLPGAVTTVIDVATTNNGMIQILGGGLEFVRGIVNNGRIELENGSILSATVNVNGGGSLRGNGSVVGNLAVGGSTGPDRATVSPGFSVGSLQVSGNYTNGVSAKLEIDIEGSAVVTFDTIGVGGTFQPGGLLQINVGQLTAFDEGAVYQVVTSGSLVPNAVFAQVDTVGNENIFFAPRYSTSGAGGGGSIGLQLAGFFEGDMNMNEEYDAGDVQLFALALRDSEAYFTASPLGYCLCIEPVEPGDMDDNGKFDFDDIHDFASTMAGAGASAAQIAAIVDVILRGVPEPSSSMMLLLGGVLLAISRGSRFTP